MILIFDVDFCYLYKRINNSIKKRPKFEYHQRKGIQTMAPTISQLFLVAISVANSVRISHSSKHERPVDKHMINFQTGIDLGSTFAGGMTYDKTSNRLFLTGGTYARGFFLPDTRSYDIKGEMNSDCFFTAIQLLNSSSDETDVAQWKEPTRLGYVKDIEACSTAHHIEFHDRVFLGASASGKSFGRTDVQGDKLPEVQDVSLFGEVISLSLDHIYHIAPVIPQHYIFGGHGFFNSEVNYPFAITSPTKPYNLSSNETMSEWNDAIFVASLYSKYGGQWSEDLDVTEVDISNPYIDGNVWGIAIQKLKINHSNATDKDTLLANAPHMEREWSVNLETASFQKLQATDMVFVNNILLLAGSTYDFGSQFAGEERKYSTYQDYDGFLIKIDPLTGAIMSSNNTDEKMKLRIQSSFEVDDIIHGICLYPADNTTGFVPYVYIVGSTEGDLDESGNITGSGFVMQIDLITMEVIWKDIIAGLDIEATDCAVTEDGQWTYVIGNARNDAALPGWKSNGGDDIWIRQYGAISGQPRWEEQIGSAEDENLAKGGAIVIDSYNNAIVYGNTRGSIGRTRADNLEMADTTNDIFIMTINFDGAYLAPNPNTIFQIPRYYFGERNNKHFLIISCMTVLAVVLFLLLVGKEVKWKPILAKDLLRTLIPLQSNKRSTLKGEERSTLQHHKNDFDRSSEMENESFVLFESNRGNSSRGKPFSEVV
jgi:hypothetical protein